MDETQFTPTASTAAMEQVTTTFVEPVKDDLDITKSSDKSKTTSVPPATWPAGLQGLAEKAMYFLSHASNEMLGACLVGVGATTYLLLGRVGLVIMGVAGGVVLHATWECIRTSTQDEATRRVVRERRREAAVEVAKRVLEWTSSRRVDNIMVDDFKVYANQELDFSSFGPETETAMNVFVDAVIKDYVHYWYDATLPGEQSFPMACKRTFTAFLLSLTGHLRRKRPADAFLDFVTNASSIIIVFLNELSAALNASPLSSAEDAIATYLELKPDSSLSYILDEGSQKAKLEDAAEDILQAYLDPKAYNCPPVHVFLKQVLAQLILGYTVNYCSTSVFINEWIVYGLEESETTKEVMHMVDAGVEGRQGQVTSPDRTADKVYVVPDIKNKKEAIPKTEIPQRPVGEHQRHMSRAEEAMDEAMQEAKRLTQLIIQEDEKRAREEQEKHTATNISGNVSDATTQEVPTPTSSESEKDRQSQDVAIWKTECPATQEQLPPTPPLAHQFTSFDQILPSQQPTALNSELNYPQTQAQPPNTTLHNANIAIFDDSVPGERSSIKAKPTIDYLIQVEPTLGSISGWMISRKYADFETLHEVLRRISVITGVPQFTKAHSELPKWKAHTKASLRSELEAYLTDAVRFQPLAESEGMKRFLEKDQGLSKSPSGGMKGFGWPTPDAFGKFGGDMMNVLTKAPKQVGAGGKAVLGGVAGLVGGAKRPASQSQLSLTRTLSANQSVSGSVMHKSQASVSIENSTGSLNAAKQSQDSLCSASHPKVGRQGSLSTTASGDLKPRPSTSSSRLSTDIARPANSTTEGSASPKKSIGRSEPESDENTVLAATSQAHIPYLDGEFEAALSLPPPPSEMPDDFDTPPSPTRKSTETSRSTASNNQMSNSAETPPTPPPRPTNHLSLQDSSAKSSPKAAAKPKEPLSDRETAVAVELMFAVIQELYTLSSAWQIRRTLLSAAKNFLLRPGNPQLVAITQLLQESLLDSNLSDSGIAAHIYKLRYNTLPTVAELEAWKKDYPEKTAEQKEELRAKARKLLVQKGMPIALQSVMGAAASGEALGKVFDCLQIEKVGRGLVFGLLLQALRIITQ